MNNKRKHISNTVSRAMKGLCLAVLTALSLTSCENYLDVVPDNDIKDIESTFEKREDAYKWLKTCFLMITDVTNPGVSPAYWGADEVIADDYWRNTNGEYLGGPFYIGDGLQMAQTPYCGVWSQTAYYAGIRYCNTFLENIDGTYGMDDYERRYWKGMVKALKAQYYFELMRRYGPIVLVAENIDAAADIATMQQPRMPIDSCVNAIVELCDEAINDVPLFKETSSGFVTYFTKEGVAALKAMTLLYAASPLFNGNDMMRSMVNKNGERLFPEYDKEKWRRAAEAAEAAISIATVQGDRKLCEGSATMPSEMLNVMYDNQQKCMDYNYSNPEVLQCVRQQSPAYNELSFFYHPKVDQSLDREFYDWQSDGGMSCPIKMVEMYYTEHGLPITEDKQWMASKYQMSKETDARYKDVVALNEDVLSLHRRREPRFYADILAQGTYWYRNSTKGVKVATKFECYQGQKFGTQSKRFDSSIPQTLSGYAIKKHDNVDCQLYNYLNYNRTERGDIVWRLADLYLAAAEAWNEYLDAPNEMVYEPLNKVRRRAGILDVQTAWETYARNPSKVTTKVGMRDIIRQEWNIEFAFEGRRYYNLRRWMTAQDELNEAQYGWNILESTPEKFFNNFREPVPVWKKRSFTAPRDYFTPLPSEEILISGCVQNPGW